MNVPVCDVCLASDKITVALEHGFIGSRNGVETGDNITIDLCPQHAGMEKNLLSFRRIAQDARVAYGSMCDKIAE